MWLHKSDQSAAGPAHSKELTLTKPILGSLATRDHYFGLELFGKRVAPNSFQLANVSGDSLFLAHLYSKLVTTDVADHR